ncbi:MAG: helix-hairpin-helix domain-containing protein [Candidatus Aenigmarchaeota archaeon]|nr:helix-hairpin-helix domain-containing protein [Candidatus Aenigmarchaeota archaeon]
MNTAEKIAILGSGCKFDACSCYPAMRQEKSDDRIGDGIGCSITHSATPDGKPVSLFKVLYSNACIFDCKYCPSRSGCSIKKTMFNDSELAGAFMKLYVQNYVEGLFLSSGVIRDADFTMEKMLSSVRMLREKFKYRGYVHLKVMPGASRELVKQAAEVADRLSINVEAPSQSRLAELSDLKDLKIDVLRRQRWMAREGVRAGHSTQFVVGGAGESDQEILKMADWEYREVGLQKAYYSAFTPVCSTPLQGRPQVPVAREVSLYRADFLLRSYKVPLRELQGVFTEDGMLPLGDPKVHLARARFDGPVDINEASREDLLRIPGIGHVSAARLLQMRASEPVTSFEQLHHMGIVLKRARPFLKVNGHAQATLAQFGGEEHA